MLFKSCQLLTRPFLVNNGSFPGANIHTFSISQTFSQSPRLTVNSTRYEQVDKVATGGKKCFSNRLKFLHVFIRQLRHRSDLKMKEGKIRRSCTSGLQDFADVG